MAKPKQHAGDSLARTRGHRYQARAGARRSFVVGLTVLAVTWAVAGMIGRRFPASPAPYVHRDDVIPFSEVTVPPVDPHLQTVELSAARREFSGPLPKPPSQPTADMELIPKGPFFYGVVEQEINLPAFYIDPFEVSQAQYARFLEYVQRTGDHSRCHPDEPPNKDHTPLKWGDRSLSHPTFPVVGLDFWDAQAYAGWVGKRLPTEQEWEKAARGTDRRLFPWGDHWDPSRCNSGPSEGNPHTLLPVDSLPEGRSPYGCYHMVGNAAEWTSSLVDEEHGLYAGRGYCWVLGAWAPFLVTFRMPGPREFRDEGSGLRCALDASPTTPRPVERPSVADELRAIEEHASAETQAVGELLAAAQCDDERARLAEQLQAIRRRSSDQSMNIVRRHPEDPASFDALRWLSSGYSGHQSEAIDLLLAHHLGNQHIGTICLRLGKEEAHDAERLLRAAAQAGPSEEARCQALLGWGYLIQARLNGEGVTAKQRDEFRHEAEQVLESAIQTASQITAAKSTLADQARRVLFEVRRLSVGQQVPELAGVDLAGSPLRLTDFRGKVVLIMFWAHWCPACQVAFPYDSALVQRLSGRPFEIFGINCDDHDGDAELRLKNESRHITWRSLKNRQRHNEPSIAEIWNTEAWPTMYLIDHRGVICHKWIGAPSTAVLDAAIDELVAEAESPRETTDGLKANRTRSR